jgi:hypothetical protein
MGHRITIWMAVFLLIGTTFIKAYMLPQNWETKLTSFIIKLHKKITA